MLPDSVKRKEYRSALSKRKRSQDTKRNTSARRKMRQLLRTAEFKAKLSEDRATLAMLTEEENAARDSFKSAEYTASQSYFDAQKVQRQIELTDRVAHHMPRSKVLKTSSLSSCAGTFPKVRACDMQYSQFKGSWPVVTTTAEHDATVHHDDHLSVGQSVFKEFNGVVWHGRVVSYLQPSSTDSHDERYWILYDDGDEEEYDDEDGNMSNLKVDQMIASGKVNFMAELDDTPITFDVSNS